MKKIKSKAVRVKLKDIEKTKNDLKKKRLIDDKLKILKKDGFGYIPVIRDTNLETADVFFEKNKEKIDSYKESIDIPDKIRKSLPSSFDIIGEIAVIKLDNNINKYKKEVGEAILKTNKNIKTVCMVDPISGQYRTRNIEIIAGIDKTKTIHKEFNLSFFVDIKSTYFSPRLANERKRIADLVKDDETIVDMFTGVAPFPIMICKYSNPKIIYAIDKNKDAIDLAKVNIRKNKAYDKIKLICDNSKNVKKLIGSVDVDRVIMNLPFSSFDFFSYALDLVSGKTIIHYYGIINEDKIESRIKDLEKIAITKNISFEKCKVFRIKSYSPREFYIGIDITAKKEVPM